MPATAERRGAVRPAAKQDRSAKTTAARKAAAAKTAAAKPTAAKKTAAKKTATTKAAAATRAAHPRKPAAPRRRAAPDAPAPRPALALSIQLGERSRALPVDRPQLRRWVLAALAHPAELVLRFVAEAEGRALNRAFRGRDYATNVLTFPYDDPDEGDDAPLRADIVICLPVLAREARAQRKTLRDHLAHLVIHGVLHAQGWDHLDDAQAQAMEACERHLLARFRIADPYLDGRSRG